jgi:hypothetical protein
MIRTPLYRSAQPGVAGEERAGEQETDRDGYLTKLIKYVPGEIVAVFAGVMAASASVSQDDAVKAALARGVFLFFLIATPAYFWLLSVRQPSGDRPMWYFYVLSVLAFAIWALAVSAQVRGTFGASPGLSEFLLALGAFAIPFFDEALTAVLGPKPAPNP